MWSARQNLIDWAAGLEPGFARGPRWPAGWLASAALITALLATAAFTSLRDVFGLQFWPVFGLQMLCLAFTASQAILDARVGLTPLARGVAILGGGFLLQLFASSVVVFSEAPGSFALASVPLVAWWFHGLMVRPTLRTPLLLGAHTLGMVCALALRPDVPRALVLLLAFPLGATGALLLGSLADADARRRRHLRSHRAAIEAQALEAQAIERDRIADTLALLAERQDDARRLLTAALAEVGRVDAQAQALRDAAPRSEVVALARGLRAGLQRLEHAVADSGPSGVSHGPAAPPEPVDAARVAREVAAEAARRFVGVAISGPAPDALDLPRALVRGGVESLQRILEHLVENACQGDGASGARAVEIAVSTDAASVDVIVRDDGPGLRAELLAAPVRPFVTTKREGTGLGLYTASSLAASSGGELLRENPVGGGARLTLRLPAAERDPA